MTGRIEPTESFSITKSYFQNIKPSNCTVAGIAAKVSVAVFPLFILITLFTLLADVALMTISAVCYKAKPTEKKETPEEAKAFELARLQPLPDSDDAFFDEVVETAPVKNEESRATTSPASLTKKTRHKVSHVQRTRMQNTQAERAKKRNEWAKLSNKG